MKQLLPRREYMVSGSSMLLVGGAGCLGEDNGDDEADHDDIPDDQISLADAFVEAIEDEFSVDGWRITDRFIPEFYSENDAETDIPVLAEAYADIVAEGFDYHAMPTALDETDSITYMVNIDIDWATSYLDEDIDLDDYVAKIEDTIH